MADRPETTIERRACADQITNPKHLLAGKWRGVVRERSADAIAGWSTWESVWRSSQTYTVKATAEASARTWMAERAAKEDANV